MKEDKKEFGITRSKLRHERSAHVWMSERFSFLYNKGIRNLNFYSFYGKLSNELEFLLCL